MESSAATLASPVADGPPAPGQPAAGNVPVPISSFVGREQEAQATRAALEASRLVTLVGPAGVGKTRLALNVGGALGAGLADGAWFVDLAPLADGTLVPHTVASALGLREESPDDVGAALVAHLGRRRLLLIIDNCEHVVDACAELARAVLMSSPTVSVLATSREPLRIPGERVLVVAPLPVPPVAVGSASDRVGVEASPAVRLFVERAVGARPEFALDDATAATVGEICRRLEGIPLAIELAASRMRALSPDEILANLEDRFRFLTRGDRTASRRHRTLEAALDWSFELLSEAESHLFRRLAVFAGPFSASTAEQVCAGPGVAPFEVAAVLEQLVDKSLLAAELTSAGARFRLLETVGDYARSKVDAGERHDLERAHGARYAALAEAGAAGLRGGDQRVWLERLDTEHDNLRAALSWALSAGEAAVALRLAASLGLFWRMRGHWSEGRQWLRRALDAGAGAEAPLRADASWALGMLAGLMGDKDGAMAAAEEAAALSRAAEDLAGTARALTVLGLVWLVPHPLEARVLAEEAVALAREAGDRWALTEALGLAGDVRVHLGQLDEGRRLFHEALELAREAGDERAVARALIGVAATTRETDAARASFEEALAMARGLGDAYDEADAVMFLGNLAVMEQDLSRARELLEECLGLAQEIGSPLLRARALGGLGRLALADGRPGTAAFVFDEAIALARGLGLSFVLVRCLTGRAETAARQRDRDGARRWWEEALEVATTTGDCAAAANIQLCLGILARHDGDDDRAAVLVHQALTASHELGLDANRAAALAASGGLAVAQGRTAGGTRLLAAARELSETLAGSLGPLYQADVAAARAALGREEFDEAWAQGSALSVDDAVDYALRGRGRRGDRSTVGWTSLTKTERKVAALVGGGLTTPEIAQHLFISQRTVSTHIAHIYAKLGISSRRDLARQAASRSDLSA